MNSNASLSPLANDRNLGASGISAGSLIWIAIFVVLIRLPFFGSPAVHIDEQFYLTAADKWLHHALVPFVDVWDRKPLGIFILYALSDLLPVDPIWTYQFLATAFVIAASFIGALLGARLASKEVGIVAALIYPVSVELMEGAGGQTPVFYNLFVAIAVLLYLRALQTDRSDGYRSWSVLLGSLLFGIAIQIKYICAIEAAAASLYLLAEIRRRHKWPLSRLARLSLSMIIVGVLPTAAAASTYAIAGNLAAFWDANFVSIFTKRIWHLTTSEFVLQFAQSSLFCVFFLPFAAYGVTLIAKGRQDREACSQWYLIVIWLTSALLGALALGNPTRHYFLPTLVPLSLLTGVGLVRIRQSYSPLGRFLRRTSSDFGGLNVPAALLTIPILGALLISYINPRDRGEAADVYDVARYIRERTPVGECPFIFNRLPILYYLADVCAPSIYLFPNHLSEIAEVQTPGQGRLQELERVLDTRPPLIYVRRPYSSDLDSEALSILERTLQNAYKLDHVRRGYRQFHDVYVRADRVAQDQ